MDAFSDRTVEAVVMMAASQVGKTEVINNVAGYHIDFDPAPMIVLQPTLEMAEAWSKDRLSPMLRDTPALRHKVQDPRSRDSGNTVRHKVFPGGHVTMVGANSPSSLAMRPVRIVLCDEVDRYPASAGTEGDPISLVNKRTDTFWNRKRGEFSSPGIKGLSRIERSYEASDKRRYYMPCPHCGEKQTFKWSQVKFDKADTSSAHYVCEYSGCIISDADKYEMLRNGEWIAEAPFNGIAGFHINGIYSPFLTFERMAKLALDAKRDPEELKSWVNTFLAETWEEDGEQIETHFLLARRENWKDLPDGVLCLTAGVDVQADRLEVEVVGWGIGEESWSVAYHVLYGDPNQPDVWDRLTELRHQQWKNEAGDVLHIACTAVDSGFLTQSVYDYCKKYKSENVFAVKGKGGAGLPILSRPNRSNRSRIKVFTVGADTSKERTYSRLMIQDVGDGYCHFPAEREADYFEQLTAERRVTKYHQGRPKLVWIKTKARNEALDLRVYAMAALYIVNINLDQLESAREQTRMQTKPQSEQQTPRSTWMNMERNGGWMSRDRD